MADPAAHDRLDEMYTMQSCKRIMSYHKAVGAGALTREQLNRYGATMDLLELTPALANLWDALTTPREKLGAFADRLDGANLLRTRDAYVNAFSECFPSECDLGDSIDAWLSMSNTTVQYIAGRASDEDEPQIMKRMHFVSFGGMLRADFFEGLAVGHAPKRCANCGRWFLTTDARHTKYCGEVCPDDPKGRTCRQIAAMKGRDARELADDHPLKAIYSMRMNTINTAIRRGNLPAETGERMKRLAKNKQQRALSDPGYANGAYVTEMKHKALLNEAISLLQ